MKSKPVIRPALSLRRWIEAHALILVRGESDGEVTSDKSNKKNGRGHVYSGHFVDLSEERMITDDVQALALRHHEKNPNKKK